MTENKEKLLSELEVLLKESQDCQARILKKVSEIADCDFKLVPDTEEELRAKKTGFKRPTLQDVVEYAKKIDADIDAERFFNYYESNGWKVGRNPMKSWQAAIVTWKKNNGVTTNPKKQWLTEKREREYGEQIELRVAEVR